MTYYMGFKKSVKSVKAEASKEQVRAVEALAAQLAAVPASRLEFAANLVKQGRANALSEKQLFWVQKLTDDAMGFGDEPIKEEIGNFAKVMALFAKAKQALSCPKINLKIDAQPVVLYLAGAKSKYPGYVQVTDGGGFQNGTWFGRVSPEGEWTQANLSDEKLKPVRRLLKALGENPNATAAAYGKMTGCCCFCKLPLTDPQSVAAGFGPTCAKNFGLVTEYKSATQILETV